jgi:low affinity Fe/Cu permease
VDRLNEKFSKIARWASVIAGSAPAFAICVLLIVVWGAFGPVFHYSDTWQLVINTSTTIITFLMVFLIQNAQNRDAKAIHLKLDELIRAQKGARNTMIDLEKLTDAQLQRLQQEFDRICNEEDPEELRTAVERAADDPKTEDGNKQAA